MEEKQEEELKEIIIEVCQNCSQHQYCTRHDEAKYNLVFEQCQAVIQAQNPGVVVFKNKGIDKPSMGAFELKFEGHLIFSQQVSGLFPSPSMMGQRVGVFLQQYAKGGATAIKKYETMKEQAYIPPQKVRPTALNYNQFWHQKSTNNLGKSQSKADNRAGSSQNQNEEEKHQNEEEGYHDGGDDNYPPQNQENVQNTQQQPVQNVATEQKQENKNDNQLDQQESKELQKQKDQPAEKLHEPSTEKVAQNNQPQQENQSQVQNQSTAVANQEGKQQENKENLAQSKVIENQSAVGGTEGAEQTPNTNTTQPNNSAVKEGGENLGASTVNQNESAVIHDNASQVSEQPLTEVPAQETENQTN